MWREYGDLVRLRVMPGFTIFLSTHPDHAEHILSTHCENYQKPDFFLKPMGLVQGKGLFSIEGKFWQKHRRLMQPAFQQRRLIRLHSVMWDCVESLLQEWEEQPADEVIDIAAEMKRLTLKIVGLALFSVDLSDEFNRLARALRIGVEYVYGRLTAPLSLPVWVPTQTNLQFQQAKRTIDSVVLEIIQNRRKESEQSDDLLSMLMDATDEETGKGLSDLELLNEMITLFNAGHDTTATSLAWTWYLLGLHPEVADTMRSEVDAVLQGGEPTFEKLPKLEYTRRVFDESLRLCPPGMGLAPRAALAADELDGYAIPKGAIVNIAFYFTLRHPDFWERPEQFEPDRFLPMNVARRPKYAYMPWGAGPHVCIGKSFAVMESVMILSAIAQRFRVNLVSKEPVEIDPRFTLRPKGGVRVTLDRRA
ncbi:Cytochrome P450 superfamily [Synechococcus sp. PCC 7335]|uniref:cytochrome P450 n=1 Tax=Synechococcus sp. (strain ATCC 29403 / PCC 7335) TaxID=91464 RepID=UPI00017EE37F|nr:cytochrome P450 [Synechococcus sp. PCC 7335]EDX85113.1 Cytochrome P450 superfamily [Synechococcus sp. PCC 7335]